MIRAIAITMLLCAGSLRAPGQGGFISHFALEQNSLSGSGRSVREVSDGYLVFGHQVSLDPLGRTHCVIFKVDQQGVFQWRKELAQGYDHHYNWGVYDPVASLDSGGSAGVIHQFNGGPAHRYDFLRLDEEGDTTGLHELVLPPISSQYGGYYNTRQIREIASGGYVVVGSRSEYGSGDSIPPMTTALLIRLNEELDTVWVKVYAQPDGLLSGSYIDEKPDGGFYLGGEFGNGTGWDKCLLISIDADGVEQWRRHIGGKPSELALVRSLSNGHALMFCSYKQPSWPLSFYQLMLTEWNEQGDIVWQKKSHYGNTTYFGDLEVLDDGSIITAGQWWGLAQLAKFSSTGDSLWSRHYEVTNSYHESYDVQATSDGGFIATGFARTSEMQGDSISGLEVIWVLKTDSLGCVVPGCQNVGVEEYVMDLQEHLHVSPNPASDLVNVLLELPEGGAVEGTVQVYVMDALSRVIFQEDCQVERSRDLKAAIDVSALPSGTYYLHLRDGKRWLAGGKVVVQH